MNDRRQERTRQALQIALDELLAERAYSDINVTDLANRAGVGRQTFYRHFDGVDAMLYARLRTALSDQIVLALSNTADTESLGWYHRVALFAFEWVAAQPEIVRIILRGEAGGDALQQFRDQITALWAAAPKKQALADASPEFRGYAASFRAGAIMALLLHWVEEGCTPDAETMSTHFVRLCFSEK